MQQAIRANERIFLGAIASCWKILLVVAVEAVMGMTDATTDARVVLVPVRPFKQTIEKNCNTCKNQGTLYPGTDNKQNQF